MYYYDTRHSIIWMFSSYCTQVCASCIWFTFWKTTRSITQTSETCCLTHIENAILSEMFAFKRIMLCAANINFPNRVILVNENLILQSRMCILNRVQQTLNMATSINRKFNVFMMEITIHNYEHVVVYILFLKARSRKIKKTLV